MSDFTESGREGKDVVTSYYSTDWLFLAVVLIEADVSELEQSRLFRSHLQ